jgi:hypothetical protein
MLLSTAAFAQSDGQKSFDKLKALSGVWEGKVTADIPLSKSNQDLVVRVTLRTTSSGNALLHEMNSGDPGDPVTVFYMDEGRLLLTHYCDAGNRPRMEAKTSPDGKTVDFELLDVSGKNLQEHMHHATFTFIDVNHHSEDWTFMMGDKMVHGHMDLHRTGDASSAASK